MHMKLRKSDFTGTGKVFRFTLVQMLKGKANMVNMLIFFLFAAGSIPVMTLMMGGEQSQFDEAEASRIAAVYVRNDTGYELDLESISRRDKFFSDTNFIDTDLMDVEWSEDTYESMVEPAEAYIHLQKDTEKMNFTR